MKHVQKFAVFLAAVLQAGLGMTRVSGASPDSNDKEPWEFTLTMDGYIVPNQDGYVSPAFAADRGWLHLEARYDYENLRTGSVWTGYNISTGKDLTFSVTPMIGAVFGKTTGLAPGCEAALSYKKIELSVSNEFVFAPSKLSSSFYFAWPQLTYSALSWLRIGLVAQRTKAYHTSLDTQRGLFVGFTHKKMELTTYVFNAGWTQPTVVLEVGVGF